MPPYLRRLCQLLLALAVVLTHSGCGKSPDKSPRQSAPPTVVAQPASTSTAINPLNTLARAAGNSERHPTEEPAWLTAAREDPDPRVRLHAIESWATNPGNTLDPVTHALVDPEESVRARAQELFEEALERR